MNEDNYITITTTDQIEENRVQCFQLEGVSIAVCKVNGDYYALHNKCSHADASFENGRIRGHRLLCPVHGAIFDVRDGSVLGAPALKPIKTYPIRIKNDAIQVCIDE